MGSAAIAMPEIDEGRESWRRHPCCTPLLHQGRQVIFQPMPDTVRHALEAELDLARHAQDSAGFWRAAERAHILSQPWPWPHTRTHAAMLGRALRERDRVEAIGQIIRLLVAGPGSAAGRYPDGNTGRARVPLTQPMPMPADLAEILARRDLSSRD